MANMLQLILKNFVNKKTTRRYPLAPERPAFERSRGRIACDKDVCILCGICGRKCPADAITVDRTKGEWKLDAYRCIICGECVNSCPKKCITMSNERRHSGAEHVFEGFQKEVPKPAPRPTAAAPKPAAAVNPTMAATVTSVPTATSAPAESTADNISSVENAGNSNN